MSFLSTSWPRRRSRAACGWWYQLMGITPVSIRFITFKMYFSSQYWDNRKGPRERAADSDQWGGSLLYAWKHLFYWYPGQGCQPVYSCKQMMYYLPACVCEVILTLNQLVILSYKKPLLTHFLQLLQDHIQWIWYSMNSHNFLIWLPWIATSI